MVARTPPKQRKTLAALNPVLLRETLNKVDQCMARLEELQYTVTGGTKMVSGVNLSPRSTRVYLRTSLKCKQESTRIKNGGTRKSPVGKFPSPAKTGEWMRMSLPAMLVGETVGEILQASQFAREIVSAVGKKSSITTEDPKTPMSCKRSSQKVNQPENTQLKSRRKKEKQVKLENGCSPSLQRARSRINFKVSPPKVRDFDKESSISNNKKHMMANRVSPRNRPWAKKTVLFPNPLFLSTHSASSSHQQQFCKTRSPIISRKTRGTTTTTITTPHKFLIKSPPTNSASKFQVRVKTKSPTVSISPTRLANLSKNNSSPKRSAMSKFRRSFSPSRLATRLVSLSPLRSKKAAPKSDAFVSGLKQRPGSSLTAQFRRT